MTTEDKITSTTFVGYLPMVSGGLPLLNIKEKTMPLYMDMHKNVQGLTAEGVAEAHKKDLEVQAKHGVSYLHYWYNEADGTVFCLCEAPSKEAAAAVHREAHGGVADEIVEVTEGS